MLAACVVPQRSPLGSGEEGQRMALSSPPAITLQSRMLHQRNSCIIKLRRLGLGLRRWSVGDACYRPRHGNPPQKLLERNYTAQLSTNAGDAGRGCFVQRPCRTVELQKAVQNPRVGKRRP